MGSARAGSNPVAVAFSPFYMVNLFIDKKQKHYPHRNKLFSTFLFSKFFSSNLNLIHKKTHPSTQKPPLRQPSTKSQKPIKSPGEQFSRTFDTFLEAQSQNPEAKYRVQLTKMRHTGFTNTQKCIAALDECAGEVTKAIDMLLKQGATN